MSYMQLSIVDPKYQSFTKAVISLWFRVPKKSIDAAREAYKTNPAVEPVLNGIIPLVTFGERTTRTNYNQGFVQYDSQPVGYVTSIGPGPTDATWGQVDVPAGDFTYTEISETPWNPSYIGVRCRRSADSNEANDETHVVVSFQTGKKATLTDYDIYTSGAIRVPIEHPSNPITTFTLKPSDFTDGSFGETGVPESYDIEIKIDDIDVFADAWHHIIVSCDLSNEVSTIASPTLKDSVLSYNSMWVALDDVNYDGYDAFPNFVPGFGDGKNKNVTVTNTTYLPVTRTVHDDVEIRLFYVQQQYPDDALFFSGQYTNATGLPLTIGTVTAQATLESTGIELSPVGFPASEEFKDNIREVELAEFLMWTDVTLDTSIEANRRLFITSPGKKTQKQFPPNPSPVYAPINKFAFGDPSTWDWDTAPDAPAYAPPISASDPLFVGHGNKLLGTPAIDLAGSSVPWMSGMNLGKLKGKVVRTGKIKQYVGRGSELHAHDPVIPDE